MKTCAQFSAFALLAVIASAQPAPTSAAPSEANRAYEQQLYAPATALVSPEKAKQVVDAFRAAYEKLGQPSLLLYVNRELVDETSGLRLAARTEHVVTVQTETKSAFEPDPNAPKPATPAAGTPQTQVIVVTGGINTAAPADSTAGKASASTATTHTSGDSTFAATPKPAAALADRQTVRDIERLFGRPLRAGGARLADQRAATELMADQPLDHFTAATSDAARKDREALARVADVVIEVLVSSRTITVPGISADQTVTVPDIQATAIRLKDSVIIGQASATDVLGKNPQAARLARQFDVNDIAEATALALMEDIALTGKN